MLFHGHLVEVSQDRKVVKWTQKKKPKICKAADCGVISLQQTFAKSSFFCMLLMFMVHKCVSSVKLACVCAQQEVGVAQGP